LGALAIKCRELGPLGRLKRRQRVVVLDQSRMQPRDIELLGDEIALQMAQLGIADRRIELDQHLVRLTVWPSLT
jgi:hypothetical protein